MAQTKIPWAEHTWNPITGCTKLSQGCKNCYAKTQHPRLKALHPRCYGERFEDVKFLAERLSIPLKRRIPTRYFVNSTSDLFQESVTDEQIGQIMDVIRRCPQHQFVILTKRAERMHSYFSDSAVPENVILGVSIEDRRNLDRMDYLKATDAKARVISFEPLLEDLGDIDLTGIHWALVGGESGHKARRMQADWARNLLRICRRDGVGFFFKQWGQYDEHGVKVRKMDKTPKLDGVVYQEEPTSGQPGTGKRTCQLAPLPCDQKVSSEVVGLAEVVAGAFRQQADMLDANAAMLRRNAALLEQLMTREEKGDCGEKKPCEVRRSRKVRSTQYDSYEAIDADLKAGRIEHRSAAAYKAQLTKRLAA